MALDHLINQKTTIAKVGGLKSLRAGEINKNSERGSSNKKITNGLSDDNDAVNPDDGDIATDDTKPGADSTVNSKGQDAKTTVKDGTLKSDVDKSPNNNAPRGGPEGYAAHSPTGFNGDPASNYRGYPNLPPGGAFAGLSGLGSLFGGPSGPPPGFGTSNKQSSPGVGSITPPKASRPQTKHRPEAERKRPSQEPKFSEKAQEVVKKDTLSAEERKIHSEKYGEVNKFTGNYIEAEQSSPRKTPSDPFPMPDKFRQNYESANDPTNPSSDKELAQKMNAFHGAKNDAIDKAYGIGEKQLNNGTANQKIFRGLESREFQLGSGETPIPGTEPLKQAYDAINTHLKDKGYLDKEDKPLTARSLLEDGKALENSTSGPPPLSPATEEEEASSGRSESSSRTKLSLDMNILDNDQLVDLDFKDPELESESSTISFDFEFDDSAFA